MEAKCFVAGSLRFKEAKCGIMELSLLENLESITCRMAYGFKFFMLQICGIKQLHSEYFALLNVKV